MATVYLARDLKHDRQVALKVLHPHLAAHIGADRFLKEIKTTAHMQHPHILALFDSGDADGSLFYVMPYVDGESLRERITREKRLPVADAVRITSEVASALDYAHRHGVIHRDIKPENILLHDGRALVADFGIALAPTTADGRLTEAGMSVGTPAYMSPEQALGERHLDARSDVYAVGVMLYEMLTGRATVCGVVGAVDRSEGDHREAGAAVAAAQGNPGARRGCHRHSVGEESSGSVSYCGGVAVGDRGPVALLEGTLPPTGGERCGQLGVVGCVVAISGLAVRPWQGRHTAAVRAPPDTAARRLVAEAADWAKRRDGNGCEMAIKLYSHATDIDTSYAGAWAGLAKTYALCAVVAPGDPTVGFAAAKSASETALRLDSTLSDAYTARGMILMFREQNFPAAQLAFEAAISRDSTRFEPWFFRSRAYVAVGELDSAVSSMRRAKELQPAGDAILAIRLATVLRYDGQFEEAARTVADVLRGDSTNRVAHTERLEIGLATGTCDSAGKDVPWLEHGELQYTRAQVALYWARCGEPARARKYADSVAAQTATGAYVDSYSLALVYAGLGDSAKMFQSLNQAVANHNGLLFYLGQHWVFRPYHRTREFAALIKRAHVK